MPAFGTRKFVGGLVVINCHTNARRKQVTLSAEEADMARRCNISYKLFAAKKLELQHRKQMDPERYAGKG